MGLVKPCAVANAPLNTGVDCQIKMSSTSLIIMVPAAAKWQASDEATFLTYLQARVHDVPSKRWLPLFGNAFPIRTITDGKESDVTVTYDDGAVSFIRNGTITRTFMTNKGGLALAQAFLSFNRLGGWAFIEVDKYNNVLRKQNDDGSFSGVPLNVAYASAPELAGLKDEFKPAFSLNYTVENYINKGVISFSQENLLDLTGLINAQVTSAGGHTVTKLRVGVSTIGAQTDLVDAYPTIASVGNFVVSKAGVAVVPTAVAIVNGVVEITVPAQTSGSVLSVALAAPSVLNAASISGFEGTVPATCTIP
jgi:hypothetical protein